MVEPKARRDVGEHIGIGMRVRGDRVALQVWDTGPAIPENHMRQIYDEFHRYQQPFDWGEPTLGLGLWISQRVSRLLQHELDARSRVDHCSMFSIVVPRGSQLTECRASTRHPGQRFPDRSARAVRGQRLQNRRRHAALLGCWQVDVITAATVDEALQKTAEGASVMLVDDHLHDRLDGLATLDDLRTASPGPIAGALLTADGCDELKREARERGYRLLTKPAKPASLRAFLAAHHVPLQLPSLD